MVTRYGQADVPREVSGRGGPAVRPAAADFPRDVCLTVSRNHAVFLFYPGVTDLTDAVGLPKNGLITCTFQFDNLFQQILSTHDVHLHSLLKTKSRGPSASL